MPYPHARTQVRIAAQVYQFIDDHIQKLDGDLTALNSEVESDKAELGLSSDQTAYAAPEPPDLKPAKPPKRGSAAAAAAAEVTAAGEKKKKGKRQKQAEAEEAAGACALLQLQTQSNPPTAHASCPCWAHG